MSLRISSHYHRIVTTPDETRVNSGRERVWDTRSLSDEAVANALVSSNY
jgi:hypothetical protein